MTKYSRHFSYVDCNDISTRSISSFDNLFFKFNVLLPLVTGELLQKTVDVSNVTYKLYEKIVVNRMTEIQYVINQIISSLNRMTEICN